MRIRVVFPRQATTTGSCAYAAAMAELIGSWTNDGTSAELSQNLTARTGAV